MKIICFIVIALLLAVCTGEEICHQTGRPPNTPYGLELCYMYSHNACCLAGYDEQIVTAYQSIIPGGSGCKPGSQRIHAMLYDFLRYLCIPCDPREPAYRFKSAVGDIVDGGIVPPSTSSSADDYTWRVCKSFLYGAPGKNEGIWGKNASQYNECGIGLQSCLATPIFNIETATFEYPTTSCTSETEIVIPSITFKDASSPALEILSRIAQTFSDFQIVIVDDRSPSYNYDLTPCFGRNDNAFLVSCPFSFYVVLAFCLLGAIVS